MAAPNTYDQPVRDAIIELGEDENLPVRKIQATLAAGHENLEPCTPSIATISTILRQHRASQAPSLETQEPAQVLDALTRRSLATIDKYVRSIEATPSRFDPDNMLKVMRTLVEAKGLVQSPRRAKDGQQAPTLLDTIGTREKPDVEPNTDQVAAVRSLHQ